MRPYPVAVDHAHLRAVARERDGCRTADSTGAAPVTRATLPVNSILPALREKSWVSSRPVQCGPRVQRIDARDVKTALLVADLSGIWFTRYVLS